MESIFASEFNIPRSSKIPRGSARMEDILKRSKLISDGQTIDYYDQFYRDHKLLLKLFQVINRYLCTDASIETRCVE